LAPGKARKKVIKRTGFKDELGNLKNEGVGLKKEFVVIEEKVFLGRKGAFGEKGFLTREGFPGEKGFFIGDGFLGGRSLGQEGFITWEEFAKEEIFLIKEEFPGRGGFLTKKGACKEEKKKKARTGGFPNLIQDILRILVIIAHL
jgi:hypothetical protein